MSHADFDRLLKASQAAKDATEALYFGTEKSGRSNEEVQATLQEAQATIEEVADKYNKPPMGADQPPLDW